MAVVNWGELRAERADLADAGEALFYQYGVGLAFLATVRADGGPRVHPMCPILHEGDLYGLLVPSPKRRDLLRDGRFSMHSFPVENNEDAFSVSGRARLVTNAETRTAVVVRFMEERPNLPLTQSALDDQLLFTFDIATCLLTRTQGHGDPKPEYVVWRSNP
jgi:nitroimidazol reductase NimA-like FMN-containing flavoprotein (pyridoxamine 5'-phosphate oxidase superfamily)